MKRLLIGLFIAITTVAFAGEADSLHHMFGVSYSVHSGSGLTYRFRKGEDYNLKIAGYYISNQEKTDTDKDRKVHYSLGLEYQKNIIKKDFILFYLFGGSGYVYENIPKLFDVERITRRFDLGFGFGIDLNANTVTSYPGLVLFASLGEKYYAENKSRFMDGSKLSEEQNRGFSLTGTVGFGVEF